MGVLLVLTGSGALTSLWTTVLYSDIEPGREQALQVLLPFVLGGAIAYLLDPVTDVLEKWRLPRWAAAAGLRPGREGG